MPRLLETGGGALFLVFCESSGFFDLSWIDESAVEAGRGCRMVGMRGIELYEGMLGLTPTWKVGKRPRERHCLSESYWW